MMTLNSEDKEWIDNATYEQLLKRWRTAPVGNRWFQGQLGAYYIKVMLEEQARDPEAAVRASKSIGW